MWHEAGLRRCVAATVQSGSDDSIWDSVRGSWQAGEEEQRIALLCRKKEEKKEAPLEI